MEVTGAKSLHVYMSVYVTKNESEIYLKKFIGVQSTIKSSAYIKFWL